jgi:hypothetical protein
MLFSVTTRCRDNIYHNMLIFFTAVEISDLMWFFLFLFSALYGRNPFHAQFPFLSLLQFLKSYSSLLKTPKDSKHVCTFSLLANLSSLGPVQWLRLFAASFSYRRLGLDPSKVPYMILDLWWIKFHWERTFSTSSGAPCQCHSTEVLSFLYHRGCSP